MRTRRTTLTGPYRGIHSDQDPLHPWVLDGDEETERQGHVSPKGRPGSGRLAHGVTAATGFLLRKGVATVRGLTVTHVLPETVLSQGQSVVVSGRAGGSPVLLGRRPVTTRDVRRGRGRVDAGPRRPGVRTSLPGGRRLTTLGGGG